MAGTELADSQRLGKALAHPLRPRLLAILSERPASPNQMARELGEALGTVSYHTRILLDFGLVELVRTEPRRGAVEHFYRAVERPVLDPEASRSLPATLRRQIAGQTLSDVFNDARAAGRRHGFDDPDVHVSRTLLDLDEKGWERLGRLLEKTVEQVARIAAESDGRLARVPEGERDCVASELAILHFRRA